MTYNESVLIYKILRTLLFAAKSEILIEKYLIQSLNEIIKYSTSNLKSENNDFSIVLIGKTIRKFFQSEILLEKILTFEFFKTIYQSAKATKFLLVKESFKILFCLFDKKNLNQDIISNFLISYANEICSLLNSSICFTPQTLVAMEENENYLINRESLILLEKILTNHLYDKFNLYFTSSTDNLKSIMILLNSKCSKIVCQALNVLYYFFLDIESKPKSVKIILHKNKDNFNKFLEKNESLFLSSPEVMEKRSFILYELEYLENYLND